MLEAVFSKLGLDTIDEYKFVETLGGGSAITALYEKGDEKVVFKFLFFPRNDLEVLRFENEFSVLKINAINSVYPFEKADLDNSYFPCIAAYPLPKIKYDLTKFLENIYFFGYEYEEGKLLSDYSFDEMEHQDKIYLLYRVASALNYFHEAGYIHRDLHPQNILIMNDPIMYGINIDTREYNIPRVKILDLGSCQLDHQFPSWNIYSIPRKYDVDKLTRENNKRILSSFQSIPPDFLKCGGNVLNYDTWAFGILMYKVLFGINELPYEINTIDDLIKVENSGDSISNLKNKIYTLSNGERLVLSHLLSPKGENRPQLAEIVRLFSWILSGREEFQNEEYIKRVIHGGGFDPDYDPRYEY